MLLTIVVLLLFMFGFMALFYLEYTSDRLAMEMLINHRIKSFTDHLEECIEDSVSCASEAEAMRVTLERISSNSKSDEWSKAQAIAILTNLYDA